MLILDHIVIAAERLEAGRAALQDALGQDLQPGGQHPAMGTHNTLLSLGSEDYLELIAIDPGAPGPAQPRWFDLDRFAGAPRPVAWACRCADLDAGLAAAPAGAGVPWDLARGDLRWRMAVPVDGTLPCHGLFPALLQWQSPPPAPLLQDVGIRLSTLRLLSPEPGALRAALTGLLDDPRLEVVQAPKPRLEVVLATPRGEIVL